MRYITSKLVVAALLLVLVVRGGSAQLKSPEVNLEGGGISIKTNESATYSIRVKNNLDEADNLTLKSSTDNTKLGLKVIEVSTTEGKVSCQSNQKRCEIPIGAEKEIRMPFELKGRSTGQTILTFLVQSKMTGLRDEERIEVAVNSGNIGQRAPALGKNELILLSILSTIVYTSYLPNKSFLTGS